MSAWSAPSRRRSLAIIGLLVQLLGPCRLLAQSDWTDYLPAQAGEEPLVYQSAAVRFRFPAGGLISRGPVGANGLLWFIADSRVLHILDEAGRALGRRELPSRQVAFIALDPFGRALLPEGPNRLSMINKAGQAVWSHDFRQPIELPPAFGPDGRVYLGYGSVVQCLAQNGQPLWRQELSAPLALPPVSDGSGRLGLALSNRQLLWFSADGRLLAEYQSLAAVAALLPIAAEPAAVPQAESPAERTRPAPPPAVASPPAWLLVDTQGGLVFLDAAGREHPVQPEPRLGMAVQAAVSQAGRLYLLESDGRLSAIGADGRLLWRLATAVRPPARLQAFPGRLVVTDARTVVSYSQDGQLFRQLFLSNATTPAFVGQGGAAFAGGQDWILYAYQFERPLTDQGQHLAVPSIDSLLASVERELFWLPGGAANEDSISKRLMDIENSLKSGSIGRDAEPGIHFAMAVAAGILEAPFGSGPVRSGPVPLTATPRILACQVLGSYGSPVSLGFLADIFATDREPAVRAAAAAAIARIGLDPDGRALAAFEQASRGSLDQRSALAMIDAIEAVYRSGGGLPSRDGATALVRMLGSAWPQTVRQRATAALASISAVR